MAYVYLTLVGLIVSLVALLLGWRLHSFEMFVTVPVVLWATLIVSSALVMQIASSRTGKGVWGRTVLAMAFAPPIVSCAWGPFAWIAAAMVGAGPRGPDVLLLAWSGIPLAGGFVIASSIALGRLVGLAVAICGCSVAVGLLYAMPNGEAQEAVFAWALIGTVVLSQIVACWKQVPRRMLPHLCPKCGYDLRGLPRAAVCPRSAVRSDR